MPEVCIAVHNGMLAAALSVRDLKECYGPDDVKAIREKIYQAWGTTYPAWYLFGSGEKTVTGLVESYARLGYEISVCPESALPLLPLSLFDLIDVQFCTIGSEFYQKIHAEEKPVTGYLPANLASKSQQALEFTKRRLSGFLPAQKNYTCESEPLLPGSDSRIWILKDAVGSDSRGADGMPYTVWTKSRLAAELPGLLSALPPGRELIISEFVATSDQYAGMADHVVHKMHFFCTRKDTGFEVRPYGDSCQKIVCNCNNSLLEEKGILPLSCYIGERRFISGRVEQNETFKEFISGLCFMGHSRLIFSVDFIIPPDGVPRYLESNKLAATFAERFDVEDLPIIDVYPSLSL
jgi:hypothetical protein